MAVAKAPAPSGFSGIHVWFIVFVALWLISTVLLVIVYLDYDKQKTAAEEARVALAKAISSEGKSLPQWGAAREGSGQTMVDLLEGARARTAELAVGDRSADPQTVATKFRETVERIRGDQFVPEAASFSANSYHAALTAMYELFRAEASALAEARQNLAARETEATELRQSLARQKEGFEEQAANLQKQIAAIESERSQAREAEERQLASFEEQIERIKQQSSEDIQNLRTENLRLREELSRQTARYTDLTAKLGSAQVAPVQLVTARQGDGTVLKATPGDEVVYIDLGSRDHLTLGLEFAVYDALQGIPEDGRAKARIEVVSINDQTAECRIVEMLRPELILPGDLVANPIYDRTRTLRFYVMGNFDLNNDGRDDADGADRIKAVVQAWGGQVSENLTAQVDFVILGAPPSRPAVPEDSDEELTPQQQRAMQAYAEYEDRLESIKVLSIPTLPQTVFLNFLGYGAQSRPLVRAVDIGSR